MPTAFFFLKKVLTKKNERTIQDSARFIDIAEKYKATALEGHSQEKEKENRKQNSPGWIGTSTRKTQQLNSPGWIGTSARETHPLNAEEHSRLPWKV